MLGLINARRRRRGLGPTRIVDSQTGKSNIGCVSCVKPVFCYNALSSSGSVLSFATARGRASVSLLSTLFQSWFWLS
ncbi:hypothetical protein G6O67_004768 [Ophiocordyceps sinensis]|uniref:Uncharacterized protein n=1 Tax=Ophiocordyceps sinensis TaxID=72228 RepID=A0A8H4V530_9HYPO|nr:hypothetical protein G6O67_004768 [Ophiocordyceps sinensis]